MDISCYRAHVPPLCGWFASTVPSSVISVAADCHLYRLSKVRWYCILYIFHFIPVSLIIYPETKQLKKKITFSLIVKVFSKLWPGSHGSRCLSKLVCLHPMSGSRQQWGFKFSFFFLLFMFVSTVHVMAVPAGGRSVHLDNLSYACSETV